MSSLAALGERSERKRAAVCAPADVCVRVSVFMLSSVRKCTIFKAAHHLRLGTQALSNIYQHRAPHNHRNLRPENAVATELSLLSPPFFGRFIHSFRPRVNGRRQTAIHTAFDKADISNRISACPLFSLFAIQREMAPAWNHRTEPSRNIEFHFFFCTGTHDKN